MEMKTLNDIFQLKPHNIGEVTPEEIREALNQPLKKPNTDKIYCGIEFAEKFNEAMYGKGNKKNTNNTGKVSGKNARW